ncbi:MAG: hypothetical protein AAGF99_12305 [Bacteroidota bacterium]
MRLLLVLLILVAGPTYAQNAPFSGTDLGSGRVVDFESVRGATLSDAQMALVKEDRTLAALFQVTGDNTVAAAQGLALHASTDRDGGCSGDAPCIILIGGGIMHVPFSSDGGLGGTRLSFLMPQQLSVSERQAEVIGNGPMADHLRIGDGTVTGGRGTTLFSTDRVGDCTSGACLIGLEQDGFLSIWGLP